MAMQKMNWSISALSVELGIDRRTLSKKLEDLRPVEIKGNSRRYRLGQVLKHLEALDNPKYFENEIDPTTKEFLSSFASGFFDEWADPLSVYLWRATKPFPGVTAADIFLMVKAIWTIQLATLNSWLYQDDTACEEQIRTPSVIESLNNSTDLRKAIKALEKTSRTWPHLAEEMNSKKNGKTKKKGGTRK